MGASNAKKNNKKETINSTETTDPQAQLKEIQQLLFGEQIAGVNQSIENLSLQSQKQFAEMDKQIKKSIELLKTDLNKQLDELSQHVEKLSADSQNRDALLEDETSSLQQELNAFQAQTESAQNDLEKLLFSEGDKLSVDLNSKYKELLEKLNSASGDLSESKTDRKTLAKLLVNMANSLEGDSN
jgi:hypothetical protein